MFVLLLFGLIFHESGSRSENGKLRYDPGILRELRLIGQRYSERRERTETTDKIKSIVSVPNDALYDSPESVALYILEKCEEYDLDPALVLAIIRTESNFQRFVVSRKGAVGLMQLLPPTASEIAPAANVDYSNSNVLYDHRQNIALGTYYLSELIKKFGDKKIAVEAYNRGPSAIRKTIRNGKRIRYYYADRVWQHYEEYSHALTSM
jgi:hypothetical protein